MYFPLIASGFIIIIWIALRYSKTLRHLKKCAYLFIMGRKEELAGEKLKLVCNEDNRLAKTENEDYPDSFVYRVLCQGHLRAVKRINYTPNSDDARRIEREWLLQMELDHHNVLKIHQLGRTEDFKFVVMDLCAASLDRLFADKYMGPRPVDPLETMHEIASGVAYIHSKNVIHRDIKPKNILITFDGRIKVADFGCAKRTNDRGSASLSPNFNFTQIYMSPETLNQARITNKADVFSTGLLFHTFRTNGKHPFGSKGSTGVGNQVAHSIIRNIEEGRAENFDALPDQEVKELIRRMIAIKPDDRPTMEEVKQELEDLTNNRHQ